MWKWTRNVLFLINQPGVQHWSESQPRRAHRKASSSASACVQASATAAVRQVVSSSARWRTRPTSRYCRAPYACLRMGVLDAGEDLRGTGV